MRVHRLVAEKIIIDEDPLCEVEKEGFMRLMYGIVPRYRLCSGKWIRETGIPDTYNAVRVLFLALLKCGFYCCYSIIGQGATSHSSF